MTGHLLWEDMKRVDDTRWWPALYSGQTADIFNQRSSDTDRMLNSILYPHTHPKEKGCCISLDIVIYYLFIKSSSSITSRHPFDFFFSLLFGNGQVWEKGKVLFDTVTCVCSSRTALSFERKCPCRIEEVGPENGVDAEPAARKSPAPFWFRHPMWMTKIKEPCTHRSGYVFQVPGGSYLKRPNKRKWGWGNNKPRDRDGIPIRLFFNLSIFPFFYYY